MILAFIRSIFALTLIMPAMAALADDDEAGPGMSRHLYRDAASRAAERCSGTRSGAQCQQEISYAVAKNLISAWAAAWGTANGFYPVIDRNDIVQAICRCGCFAASTRILMSQDGQWEQVPVQNLSTGTLTVAVSDEASLGSLSFTEHPVKSVVNGEERGGLYLFKMADGRRLALTAHHGTVLSDGRVVAASTVTQKDSFIDFETGQATAIASIEPLPTKAAVYNFETAAPGDAGHIIVAEGFLVGDLVWQNQKAKDLGSIILRQ